MVELATFQLGPRMLAQLALAAVVVTQHAAMPSRPTPIIGAQMAWRLGACPHRMRSAD